MKPGNDCVRRGNSLLEDTSGLRKEDRSTVDDGDAVVVLEAVLLLVTPYFRGRWWIRSSLEACSGRVRRLPLEPCAVLSLMTCCCLGLGDSSGLRLFSTGRLAAGVGSGALNAGVGRTWVGRSVDDEACMMRDVLCRICAYFPSM